MSFAAAVIAVALLAAYCGARFRIVNDLTYFLPVGADPTRAELARGVAESDLSRMLAFTVGVAADDESSVDGDQSASVATAGPSQSARDEALNAARILAGRLSEQAGIAWVDSGPPADVNAEVERIYWPHRYGFLESVDGDDRISDTELAEAARRLKLALAGPLGPLVSRIASDDPLLAFATVTAGLSGLRAGGLRIEDGQYVTADGRWAVVFCGTKAGALDADAQQHTLQEIDTAIRDVRAASSGGLAIEYTGVARFAARSKELMLRDVTRVAVVSSIAVIGVLLVLFGSAGLVLSSAVVVGAGILSGLAAVLFVYGEIHALTLAIGATLIGVCEDYPIHYLNHELSVPHPDGPRAAMRKLWPPLALGAATSMLGFSSFAFTSYAGLREVAVFACAGIAGAMGVTWLLLPPIVGLGRGRSAHAQWLTARLRRVPRPRLGRIPLGWMPWFALGVGLLGLPLLAWDGSLASLNRLDDEMLATDTRVRARAMSVEPGVIVAALGNDEESALKLNDRVARRLAAQVAGGTLDGYSSLHAIVRSEEFQRGSWNRVHSDPTLARRLESALTAEGFRVEEFQAFLDDLGGSRFELLTREDLTGTSFERIARAFHVEVGDRIGILTFLRGLDDPAALERALADLDGVIVLDQKRAIDAAYAGYQSELVRLFCAGMIGVFALTALRYRSARRAIGVCSPALLAVLFTIGALSLAGVSFNLMHLAALVLVFSIGVDYGIFLEECSVGESVRAVTQQSILFASSTTVLSFGLLVLSQIPALRAVGETTSLGILASAVLAPVMLARSAAVRRR